MGRAEGRDTAATQEQATCQWVGRDGGARGRPVGPACKPAQARSTGRSRGMQGPPGHQLLIEPLPVAHLPAHHSHPWPYLHPLMIGRHMLASIRHKQHSLPANHQVCILTHRRRRCCRRLQAPLAACALPVRAPQSCLPIELAAVLIRPPSRGMREQRTALFQRAALFQRVYAM